MSGRIFEGLPLALRHLRQCANLKQKELAVLAGVTKGTLNSYETGRVAPSLEGLEKILAALSLTFADLQSTLYFVRGETPPRSKVFPEPEIPHPPGPEEDLVASVLVQFIQYLNLVSGFAVSQYLAAEVRRPLP